MRVLDSHAEQRLLGHLAESSNYSSKDIASISDIICNYMEIVGRNDSTDNLQVLGLIAALIERCRDEMKPLQEHIDRIAPSLHSIYERLISLRRCIKAAESRKKVGVLSSVFSHECSLDIVFCFGC